MKQLLIVLFFIQSIYSFAEETYVIDNTVQQVNLKNYCYHYEDTTNNLSINEVLKQDWAKLKGVTTFATNKYVQWTRYELYNPYKIQLHRILFIPYHHIHEIDAYLVTDSSIINISSTGIKRPFSNKHIKSIGYPIRINIKPGQTASIIIRFKHLYRPLRTTTFLLSEEEVDKIMLINNSLVWFWRGMFLFAVFISLIIYCSVRLILFLYYFLLNLGIGLFIASQLGDYFLFFNTDTTDFTSVIDFTGTILINLFLPLFLNALTPIKERNKSLWKWMYYFIYFMIVIYIVNLIPSIRSSSIMLYSHFYLMFVSGLVFLLQLILLLKSSIYRDKNAIPLFIIYAIYISIVFIDIILPNMGIVADSPYVHNSLLIASIFEIFSFMVLMAMESLVVFKERSELLNKQQEHQEEIIVSMVKGQELERNRAGRELHDSIGANMAIIKQLIDKGNDELYKIVSQTIESVRNLSHGLITPQVKNDEFIDEMKELCFLFTSDETEIHCYFHNWPQIDDAEITTHLYRITQELLQNAIKHSNAKNVHLQFIGDNKQGINLIYEDDGSGFNIKNKGKGQGLKNIENRLTLLNGNMQIDTSKNGKGCTIVIEVEL